METGTCKLCLTPDMHLRDSHFLPRSFYSLFRDGKNEPIRFSNESVYPTSKQIKDYVFCGICEETFNRDGENWVRPLLPTIGGPFPLRDRVMKATPLYRDEEMAVFPTAGNPEIEPAKLMNFGLGVFYKAAVHSWRGDSTDSYMPMEADDVEALRLYLLGKAPLTKGMVLCVTVDSLDVPLQSMNEPYRMPDSDGFKRYSPTPRSRSRAPFRAIAGSWDAHRQTRRDRAAKGRRLEVCCRTACYRSGIVGAGCSTKTGTRQGNLGPRTAHPSDCQKLR